MEYENRDTTIPKKPNKYRKTEFLNSIGIMVPRVTFQSNHKKQNTIKRQFHLSKHGFPYL